MPPRITDVAPYPHPSQNLHWLPSLATFTIRACDKFLQPSLQTFINLKSASEMHEKVLQPSQMRQGTNDNCIEVEVSLPKFLECLTSVEEALTTDC